jgi:hypothetical protein
MNDVQKAAIDRANAAMKPALELYEERNKLTFFYYLLSLRDLKRLNKLIATLTDEEMQRVARYAEGLALWREPESYLADAADSQGQAPDPSNT